MIRDNLPEKRSRAHYNFKGKTKQTFNDEKEAKLFLKKLNLKDYVIYQCKICNKYHIGHEIIKKEKNK